MIQGYLLDTNIFEYWHNESRQEHTAVRDHLKRLHPDTPLRTSLIVLGEVSYGLYVTSSKNRVYPKQVLDFIQNEFPRPLPLRGSTTHVYGMLRAALFDKYAPKKRNRGLRPEQLIDPVSSLTLGIQENDLWIAAQALDHNLVLVTNDQMKHLRSVASDLRVENWALS